MLNFFKQLVDLYQRIVKSGVEYAKYKGVSVGNDCRIYTRNFGSEPWLISIGNKVTITSGVVLLTHDGSTWLMTDDKGRRYRYSKVEIGNNVFIGVNSIIMPGVIIQNDVIVAAGSIVTKSIPQGSIVAGNPAKVIGNFYDYKKRVLENYKADIDMDYSQKYKNRINLILDLKYKEFLK